jgi:hypothetical protein
MTSPFGTGHQMVVGAQATAGSDLNTNLYVVPRDGTVSAVAYAPVTAITGANTNTRSVSLVNKGTDGTGVTVIATLQFNSGVNAAAGTPTPVTLSGTPANLAVTAGQLLQWQSTHVGTGIADPGGLATVTVGTKYA